MFQDNLHQASFPEEITAGVFCICEPVRIVDNDIAGLQLQINRMQRVIREPTERTPAAGERVRLNRPGAAEIKQTERKK